jgi:hypothetical protein
MIAFRACCRTPLNNIIFAIEIVLIAFSLLFLGWKFVLSISGKTSFSSYELFLCFLLIFPFWSATAAYFVWGQPFLYGIGSQRAFFLFTMGFYLLYALDKGFVDVIIIRKAFLILAWVSLIGFYITGKVINPANYLDTDFVEYNEAKGGYIFRFIVTFISFGFIYYLIKFFKSGNIFWGLCSIILLSYLVFVRQDRSIILTVLATATLYITTVELRRNFVKIIFSFLVVLLVGASVLMTIGTDVLDPFFKKYENIISTLEGERTKESSTNIRRTEAVKVAPYIAKNPILGSGDLSGQWRNGFQRKFDYLYPSDIGVIGEIFIFGVLGTLLINSQFILGWYYIRKTSGFDDDIFYLSCKFILFSFFMDSLTAGQTVYYSANSILVITILYFYSLQTKRQQEQIA